MISKRLITVFLISFLLALALFIPTFLSQRYHYGNRLAVLPLHNSTAGLSAQSLEKEREDKLLLTYRVEQMKKVRAIQSGHNVNLIGTNHAYPHVMGYQMRSGGFFTEAAQKAKDRHVVLNEKAAFDIFGSTDVQGTTLRIDGLSYLVVGVVSDLEKEQVNVYIPATVLDGNIQRILVLYDQESGISKAFVLNELKQLGIDENTHAFYDLGGIQAAIWQCCFMALRLFIFLIMMVLGIWEFRRITKYGKQFESALSEHYFIQLLSRDNPILKQGITHSLFFAGCVAGGIMSLAGVLPLFLNWKEIQNSFLGLHPTEFVEEITWLQKLMLLSNILFGAFLAILPLTFIILYLDAKGKKPKELLSDVQPSAM